MSRTRHAHPLVLKVAQEMAGAVYEELARNNDWYALNRNQASFIRRTAPSLLDQARKVLAGMLAGEYDSNAKDEIAEALFADHTLRRGREQKTGIIQ